MSFAIYFTDEYIPPLRSRYVDISGKRYGRLVANRVVGKSRTNLIWECICDCGNVKNVPQNKLGKGTFSCGCLRKELSKNSLSLGTRPKDLSGLSFYDLIVLEKFGVHPTRKNNIWKCKCICGNETLVRTDALTGGRVKSCGCRTARVAKERMSKSNHPNWKGGVYGEYSDEWTYQLKEIIRIRDNRTCQYPDCLHTDINSYISLDVHHIDGNKKNCQKTNLISLCHKHHMKVESNNPRSWEEYFHHRVIEITS